MNSLKAISLLKLAGLFTTVSLLAACSQKQMTKNEMVYDFMERAPFLAPMAAKDIEEPQEGYKHMPIAITGGKLYLMPKGTDRGTRSSSGEIERQEIVFPGEIRLAGYGDPREVVPGFTPTIGSCSYNAFNNQTWRCGLFRNEEEAETYSRSALQGVKKFPVDVIACIDCVPKPDTTMLKICPGKYQSIFQGPWQDKTIPGEVFTKEGGCTYEQPWWRTDHGLELGVKKFEDEGIFDGQ